MTFSSSAIAKSVSEPCLSMEQYLHSENTYPLRINYQKSFILTSFVRNNKSAETKKYS
jgi:hypothetical protein